MAHRLPNSVVLLSPPVVAELLGKTEGTLAQWRCKDPPKGPPFLKLPGSIRYVEADVLRWLEAQRRGGDVSPPEQEPPTSSSRAQHTAE